MRSYVFANSSLASFYAMFIRVFPRVKSSVMEALAGASVASSGQPGGAAQEPVDSMVQGTKADGMCRALKWQLCEKGMGGRLASFLIFLSINIGCNGFFPFNYSIIMTGNTGGFSAHPCDPL